MRRRKPRDPRRNVVRPLAERLEARWLLSRGTGLGEDAGSGTRDLLHMDLARHESDTARPLAETALTPIARGAGASRARSHALAAAEARDLARGDLGPWGRLRLLVRMEAQGDHQFDGLFHRLSMSYTTWAARHPARAAHSGVDPHRIWKPGIGNRSGAGSPPAGMAAGSGRTPGGLLSNTSPAGPSGPVILPLITPLDPFAEYSICWECLAATFNSVAPQPGGVGPMLRTASAGAGGNASSGSSSPGGASYSLKTMNSDANLITGEYLQDHQLATYQSLGQANGIDLQYSSLQADPNPIVTGAWDVTSDTGSGQFSSVTIQATVSGTSQGPGNVDSLIPGNGRYIISAQVVTATSTPTGILPVGLTFTKNLTAGGTSTESYNVPVMLVNGSTSHYGAGWSIAGLQQLTVGNPGQTLMIADGNNAPEEFTSTDGVNYTGFVTDTSTLSYNSSTNDYTRTYHDGSTVVFNSSGQEISAADPNGNTTNYAYLTSGPAAGALQTITDPVGLVTTLAYDSSGHLSTVTDPAGRVTTFTFDASGNLTGIEDPTGATTGYGYSSTHQMTSETNPDDHTATVTYDSFGRMSSETLFDGTSIASITPAQEQGLAAWGGTLSSSPTAANYIATLTDPNGATTTITLDNYGGIVKEVDGNGGVTTITRNAQDRPTAITDPMNRTTSYAYDSYGDITQITQPDGVSENITYTDSLGVPTEIQDFNGHTTTFVLDSQGNVTQEQQPNGVDESWTYNSAGLPLTATDGNGKTTTYAYDSYDRLTTITEPLTGSPTVKFGYDSAGDVTSVTDEVGNTTTLTYDALGRVLTSQNPVQAAASKDTAYTYDSAGNLTAITDANGHTTTYTYNARNELVNVTDPLSNVTTLIYDPEGNLTGTIDPVGNRATFTYDNNNNQLTAVNALGTTTLTYDLDNEVITATDPNNHTTTYTYNSLGEEKTVTLPGLAVPTTYTYDENGNLLTVTDPNSHTTTYIYNSVNEQTAVTDANGHTTSYSYDGNGNVLTVTDPLNHVTTYSYDPMNRVLTETQPSGGGTTTYAYDSAGDLTSLTDPVGNTTTWTYNAAREVATQTSPTGGVTTYTYDLVGNLTQTVDPDGHTIDYVYDSADRMTNEKWENPSGGYFDLITYTYDGDGRVTQVSDNNATYQYTYNADGEVTSQGDVGSSTLPTVTMTYGYDPAGNQTSMSDSLGGVVSYTYDARNELTNQTFSGTGITPEAVAYTYDNAGNMTGLARYSNLAETTVVATTSYTYDPANQLTGITDKNSGGTTLVSYGYTYDAAGRVTQEVRTWASGGSTDTLTYGYTNNNQLTSVSHTNASFANESFTWDANGNQTGSGYTTTTGNEQTASPGYTYTYDADGNMITATQTSTGDVWTYGYDFAGQMTSAVEKNSSGTTLASVTYTYDALGNRIGMDENGTQTWTLFAGSTPIMDFSGSGALATRYLNSPQGTIEAVLSRQSASGTVAWYLSDLVGTIRDLINNSGSIVDHVDYSVYGTVLDESSPPSGDRIMGFAVLERDSVTGMNLAKFRVQDPGTERWTSQDPLGFAGGSLNLSEYAENLPVIFADPSGGDIYLVQTSTYSSGKGHWTVVVIERYDGMFTGRYETYNGDGPGTTTNKNWLWQQRKILVPQWEQIFDSSLRSNQLPSFLKGGVRIHISCSQEDYEKERTRLKNTFDRIKYYHNQDYYAFTGPNSNTWAREFLTEAGYCGRWLTNVMVGLAPGWEWGLEREPEPGVGPGYGKNWR